jgi:hypothetical protein
MPGIDKARPKGALAHKKILYRTKMIFFLYFLNPQPDFDVKKYAETSMTMDLQAYFEKF